MGALGWDVYNDSMVTNIADLDQVAGVFREAAEAFAEVLDRPEVGKAWEQPSVLAGYSVGAIVAHVNGAIGWLGPLLDAPVQPDLRPSPPADLLAFLNGLKIDPGGDGRHPIHDALRDRFERSAGRGWEHNRDKFRDLVKGLTARFEGESASRLLDLRPTAPLVVRLGDFLPTRIVELVVHGDDLAASIGIDVALPESVATVTIEVMVAIARAAHGDLAVVRALSRRERADSAVFPVF